jgi:hypothetical protein
MKSNGEIKDFIHCLNIVQDQMLACKHTMWKGKQVVKVISVLDIMILRQGNLVFRALD